MKAKCAERLARGVLHNTLCELWYEIRQNGALERFLADIRLLKTAEIDLLLEEETVAKFVWTPSQGGRLALIAMQFLGKSSNWVENPNVVADRDAWRDMMEEIYFARLGREFNIATLLQKNSNGE